jgi:hypothetical protein
MSRVRRCGLLRYVGGKLAAMDVALREIPEANREAVLALRVAPGQERFVSSVRH